MSGFSDCYKSISNIDSDSISSYYNTLDRPSQTPSAPVMNQETHPPSSSANDSFRLYPKLNPNQNPPSRQDSLSHSFTSNGFVYVRESSLPVNDDYASEVYRVGEISYSKEKVMGMTFIYPFLYVLHKNSDILYKCNTVNTKSRAFIAPPMSSQTISGLRYPRGMAANYRTKHLYITDRQLSKGKGRLMKVSLDCVVVAVGDLNGLEPFGVSVGTSNEAIIVACCKNPCCVVNVQIVCAGYIVIFEDMGHQLQEQHRISLEESIQIPRHVLEAPKSGKGKEYLVVHGWVQLPGIECNHQVSRVNTDGRIVRSFGAGCGKTERHLNRPMSISFDDCDKIFVADSFNDRILLLNGIPCESYDLELVRPLVTKANGLTRPRHVCLDTRKRMLYVGKDSGHIDVFYVGKESDELSHSTQVNK